MQIRIGLSGAGGTGKGTLVKKFHERHPEIMEIHSCVEHVGKILDASSPNYKEMQAFIKPSFQQTILAAQAEAERMFTQNGLSYITERSIVDFIPYMDRVLKSIDMHKRVDRDQHKAYVNRIKAYIKDNPYTHIFFLPADDFVPANTQDVAWKERDPLDRIKTNDSLRSNLMDVGLELGIPVVTIRGSVKERLDQMEQAVFG